MVHQADPLNLGLIGPLKILHVLDHSLPIHSGYAFRTHNIFRAQLKRGWMPVGLTSPEQYRISKSDVQLDETVGGFRFYRSGIAGSGKSYLITAWRFKAALTRRLQEVVEAEKPHLLHVHSPVLNALAALRVRRKTGIPVVYEIRAFWEDAAVDHGTYKAFSWRYRVMRSLERGVCWKANQVAVLCHGLSNNLLERGIPGGKLTVVSNGVNFEAFQDRDPDPEYRKKWQLEGKQVIGFIGSFYRYEGLDLLLQSMVALARRDVALVLVGGGKMENALKEQIKRLRLEKTVVMLGKVPHERVPGVYALMDILAYPRYAIPLTELVTPLKPLEAMAMGKAIVASNIGGHRELIEQGKTGLLFSSGNVPALTQALVSLLDDRDLRERLATQALEWVRKRSWDNTTAVYADIYRRALEKAASKSITRKVKG